MCEYKIEYVFIKGCSYFWRDEKSELEVDCIIDRGISLIPIEIKSSQTFILVFFMELKHGLILRKGNAHSGYLVYGGNKELHQWNSEYVIGSPEAKHLVDIIENQ